MLILFPSEIMVCPFGSLSTLKEDKVTGSIIAGELSQLSGLFLPRDNLFSDLARHSITATFNSFLKKSIFSSEIKHHRLKCDKGPFSQSLSPTFFKLCIFSEL